ncbi:MAG: Imidazole glycerol phosphate synthase amidotransferase subunit [uncultured Sphingomonas sp.]|uniref:Imidazole glycerol phosphate synthase subunit HisH n=1 Tax=uncultured Sphingomonas sp. TaxID=158754 RepID=A0A6J4SIV1_9SPHN|nr:imidazole glycerol phosphate synthase subunit HisH [uncultured Sphingomonas sp.]CAA9499689.1 MAG: Imidazole glycerol phosphate synthase amidotransferase subunit [uncultured Sphingomonas sp.]
MTGLAVLDIGYGNTDSIRLAFERLGAEVELTADPAVAEAAERLVLPGVGSAGYAMPRLAELGLAEALRRRTRPTLGICLGMQLLFEHSEESGTPCLGLVAGRVRAMTPSPGSPVPHMGWTGLEWADEAIGLTAADYVYFAHSFACDDGPATAARANYAGRTVPAALRAGHLWGAQFHPERSSAAGANFLNAFLSA